MLNTSVGVKHDNGIGIFNLFFFYPPKRFYVEISADCTKAGKHFIDLHDNDHSYNEGDIFPREGVDVSEERLKELAGSDNKQHTPLIELVEEDPDNTAGADTAEKTSKAGKKKPENKVPENKEPAE